MSLQEKKALLSNYTDTHDGFFSDTDYIDVDSFIDDFLKANEMNYDMPVKPTREDILADIDEDPEVAQYLKELSDSETRQTSNFENQLKENQMMFDDYRSQLLGNQYQQNAQLMGSVDSAMSKARRNALEAGASAGLRMAENINTTLALQNKQAQTSLETSNQLAQQLLNQRQAAAGIRSDYNQMLDNNVERRQNVRQQAAGNRYADAMSKYDDDEMRWNQRYDNSTNPAAVYKKQQVYNSQYNQ